MTYFTAYYRSENNHCALVLQQLLRQDGIPVQFSCMIPTNTIEKSRLPKESRHLHPAEQLLAWLYDTALPHCSRGRAAHCTDRIQQLFQKEIVQLAETGALSEQDSIAALFAMGEECFYAWRGQVDIRLFQLCFGRVKGRTMTRLSERNDMLPQCVRAVLEPGAGILLGNRDFFDHVNEESLAACLQVQELKAGTQVEHHLTEAAEEAIRQGAQDVAVTFLLPASAQSSRTFNPT